MTRDITTRMNDLIADLDVFRINMEVLFDAGELAVDVQAELVNTLEPVLDTYFNLFETKVNKV